MPPTLDIEELLKLCREGNERAWAQFVERFVCLIRWAIKEKIFKSNLSIDEGDVEDLVQQVFISIWNNNKLDTIKNARSISPWLVIVAQNLTVDFSRKKNRIRRASAKDIGEERTALPAGQRNQLDSNQLYEAVEYLIGQLSLKERRIIKLELFYDLKHREIARIMGISINTISTVITRIKQDMRHKLAMRGYNV